MSSQLKRSRTLLQTLTAGSAFLLSSTAICRPVLVRGRVVRGAKARPQPTSSLDQLALSQLVKEKNEEIGRLKAQLSALEGVPQSSEPVTSGTAPSRHAQRHLSYTQPQTEAESAGNVRLEHRGPAHDDQTQAAVGATAPSRSTSALIHGEQGDVLDSDVRALGLQTSGFLDGMERKVSLPASTEDQSRPLTKSPPFLTSSFKHPPIRER